MANRPSEWTPEAVAAEKERVTAEEAHGNCPYSGYTIRSCWERDVCDCSFAEPHVCAECRVTVWDLDDHAGRIHPGRRGRSA